MVFKLQKCFEVADKARQSERFVCLQMKQKPVCNYSSTTVGYLLEVFIRLWIPSTSVCYTQKNLTKAAVYCSVHKMAVITELQWVSNTTRHSLMSRLLLTEGEPDNSARPLQYIYLWQERIRTGG